MCHLNVTISIDPDVIAVANVFPLPAALTILMAEGIETDRHRLAEFYTAVLHHNATGMWGGLNTARLRYLEQN